MKTAPCPLCHAIGKIDASDAKKYIWTRRSRVKNRTTSKARTKRYRAKQKQILREAGTSHER